MKKKTRLLAGSLALCIALAGLSSVPEKITASDASAAESAVSMDWGTLEIGGGGFVAGIIAGQNEMYLRTDVGGAYRYNYDKGEWEQLFGFLNDSQRGLLSVKGIAIDPTDDDTAYFLCGCAYFSDAKTSIFKTTDGGKTFTESDVTDLIQIHGNGDGRECIEPIAVDPDDPDTIYAGGDVTAGSSALIKSTDGGATWNPVAGYDDLGLFTTELKYPSWTEHMVRGTEDKLYNEQNGIGCIFIEDGKVYVGTSVTGEANIHVANVDDDKFTELSADLPTENYPLSITSDNNGNLFFTYIAGLAFSGTAGGAYEYDKASGSVKKLSVSDNAIGMIEADKSNPDHLLARTCGVWADQWFETEWTDDSIAWGDHFFRSTDGGETWQDVTPGQQEGQYTDHQYFVSNPIDTNGYDWIYGKACHWGSGIIIDPRNPDRIVLTSGNGVYACDNIWDTEGVQFYFDPKGVEEVVALDMVSVPGGAAYSAIGDYDGFIHTDNDTVPQQYSPNIGSTSAIAYCPSDPEVMARVSQNDAKGYYSTDAGATWNEMSFTFSGGKLSITRLESGEFRIIESNGSGSAVSYTDDFGKTWNESSGIDGSRTTYTLVDPEDPARVYGSGIKYNEYWASTPGKTEPTFDEAHYSFYISDDYGATFRETQIALYDMNDHTGDLAYISENKLAMALGWNGLSIIDVSSGEAAETKTDVFYCKTIGYGAPEKEGGPNTLYIYGKPAEGDVEGIYRSTDGGATWVCINTDHLYGGTGNGNFLVGDMNEFGKVYMSTVGCGIVYGQLSSGEKPTEPPTQKPTAGQTTTEQTSTQPGTDPPTQESTETGKNLPGDADCNGKIEVDDVVMILSYTVDPKRCDITEQGIINSDVYQQGDGINSSDAASVAKYIAKNISSLPES